MWKAMLFSLTIGSLLPADAVRAQHPETGLPTLVLEVASDSLKDVSVAIYTPSRGVIYYSPARERELGPDLAAFFRAHEFGHLYHHHTRANALASPGTHSDLLLQARELEADCYATRRLAQANPRAVNAAVRFFIRMGTFRHDLEHPTGAERAAKILSCVPTRPLVPSYR